MNNSEANIIAFVDDEHQNIKEVQKSPKYHKWIIVMEDELKLMFDNQVWDLVNLP